MSNTIFRLLMPLLAACLIAGNSSCALLVGGGVAATGAGATMLHDRRTSSTVLNDEGLEYKLRGAINSTSNLKESTHVNITAYNGIVLLTGEAPDETSREQIVALAQQIKGIKHIHSAIVIADNSSLSARSEDSYITAKAKTALMNISSEELPGFDATRVKVVTERKVVYLMGLLRHAESEAATDAVRRVKGIEKVVKIFEYID